MLEYLNAMNDVRVWCLTRINQNLFPYLSMGQYFSRDVVYTPNSYMISLYKTPEANQVRKYHI